ncbi:outer membrane beta-barrel protein [Pedobacter lusitanus]|nr:outer membrane beta-barrel protein [Pedobacter lusitanus]
MATAMTDQDGKFTFIAAINRYYIVSSSIGYNKFRTADFQLSGTADYQLPDIILTENSKNLKEVSITAAKPILERRAGKLIFNVDASPSAAGLTALELLNKAPGVTIDHNENISLAGKSNVLVTIDGKQTYLSSTEVINLLKSMQSSEIESVEVINNPGSRYDANSTGGIINIKTKKGLSEGFNGNAALSAGFNKYLLTTNTINLNYRQRNFNVFGSYGYNRTEQKRKTDIDRITPGADPLYFTQKNIDHPVINAQNFKIGTDFFLSPKHTIGFLAKGTISHFDQQSSSDVNIGKSFLITDSVIKTPSAISNVRKNFAYNINYKGILDTAGQEISIDADYSTFDGTNNANYINRFYLPNGDFLKDGLIYRSLSPSNIDIKAIKADYTLPINKKVKLETGIKIAGVKSNNNFIYENNVNGSWIFDATKSNQFLYDEKVSAAYATLNITLGKLNIEGGLRAEHTNSTGNSVTTSQLTKKNLYQFLSFPFIKQEY